MTSPDTIINSLAKENIELRSELSVRTLQRNMLVGIVIGNIVYLLGALIAPSV